MSEGIEGREPLLSKEIFIESMKYSDNQLMKNKLGKRPLREISKKYFGKQFSLLKKVGFPVDMSRIVKYKNLRSDNYNLWFKLNLKNIKRIKIGYTTGVFDLFHIGHLNILKNCKGLCDKLIVGVTTDELVKYKYKKAVIPFLKELKL